MAIKVKLEKDGFIKDGFVGYSYTSALLDFWIPAFRLDFNAFIFFFGIYMFEKFLSEFFKIYSRLNYLFVTDNIEFFSVFNIVLNILPFFIAILVAAFYNKYYTKKMLEDGWKPLENDEYSNAILKGYHYLPYTDTEIRDEDKMQRYKSFIEKTRHDERNKLFGFLIFLIIMIIFYVY